MEIKSSMINSDLIINIAIFTILISLCYSMRSLANLFLLTFFLTYVFYNIQKFIFMLLHKYIPIINRKEITIIVYIILFSFFAMTLYSYIPVTIRQLRGITHLMSNFNLDNYRGIISTRVINAINSINFQSFINDGSRYIISSLSHVGEFGVDIVLSLILSLIFTLEKEEIQKFMIRLKQSKIGFMYSSGAYFGLKFISSFGKVMKIQMITSGISAVVTFIWLTLIGVHQALGFAIMMLILTLVPVIGALICLAPLSIVAFKTGGIMKLVNVLVMIAVLHILESYVVKPKLMAVEIKLPTFIIFIVLIVSEHFMGIWGLLLGLPVFMFFLDILGVQATK